MKRLSDSKPFLYCVAAVASFMIVLILAGTILGRLNIAPGTYISDVIIEILLLTSGIVFIKGAGQEYVMQCKMHGFGKGMLAGGYFLAMGCYSFFYFGLLCLGWNQLGAVAEELQAMGIDFSGYELRSGTGIVSFIVYSLLIGLAEEFTFRGVIAERMIRHFGKDARGVKKAVLISGVLFGALHMINGFSTGLVACIVQAAVASFMGMALTLIYYKSGNIYAVSFLHAFVDFGALAWRGGIYGTSSSVTDISAAMQYSATNLIAAVPYIIVILVLMRKKNIRIILDRISQQRIPEKD